MAVLFQGAIKGCDQMSRSQRHRWRKPRTIALCADNLTIVRPTAPIPTVHTRV
jgi:hypothetical protein